MRRALLLGAMFLGACGDSYGPIRGRECDTGLFASFKAPPSGVLIDCAAVWHNVDALENLLVYRYEIVRTPPELRRLLGTTDVQLWDTEEGLRAWCQIPESAAGYGGTLYGCASANKIHLAIEAHALIHEALHVVDYMRGTRRASPHDGWIAERFHAASSEYWFLAHRSPVLTE